MVVLVFADVLWQVSLADALGHVFVPHFGVGEIAEQLANRHVFAAGGGAAVEELGLPLHAFGHVADGVELQRLDLPNRLMMDEAANVLAADQRDVLAEFFPIEVEQHAPMIGFLGGHFAEHGRTARVFAAQSLGDIDIDATVFFLIGDGEGEDFAFGQIGEVAHDEVFGRLLRCVKRCPTFGWI